MTNVHSKRMHHNRFLFAMVILLTTGVTAAFASGVWSSADRADDVIATVNGVPISIAEYNRAIRLNKSRIINYFRDTYQAEQTEHFWTTAFHGEIPAEVLKKKALEDSVYFKVRQLLAKEQGVLQDVSYDGFLQKLQQENERRVQAINNNQVIYGPAQYDEDTYLEYVLTNSMLAVKQRMQQKVLQKGESQLRLFYERHKEQRYRTQGLVKIQRISHSFLDSNHQIDKSLQQQAHKQLEEAIAKLQSGSSFEDVAAAYNTSGTELELTIQLGDERRNARSPIALTAAKLPLGAISPIIEENGGYHVLKCIGRIEPHSAYLPYEQAKNQVLQDVIQNEYDITIRGMVAAALVQLNDTQYRSFQI